MRIGMLFAPLSIILAGSVQAGELAPMSGLSINLGDVVGTAYFTIEEDGYRVVATVTSGEDATPIRFITTLAEGQKAIVSVPGSVGQSARELAIKRISNRVYVDEVAADQRLGSVPPRSADKG